MQLKSRNGKPADHCLLEMRWRDKLKCPPPRERSVDRRRLCESSEVQKEFENEVRERLGEQAPEGISLEQKHSLMVTGIAEAIKTVPARPERRITNSFRSENSMQLVKQRELEVTRLQEEEAERNWVSLTRRLKASCRRDYQIGVERQVERAECAYERGDLRDVWEAVRGLCAAGRCKSKVAPNMSTETGKLFESEEELAAAWGCFAGDKFGATPREVEREPVEVLRDKSGEPETALDREKEELSDEELERALRALRQGKAPGWEAVFVEAYAVSPTAKSRLFEILREVWRKEKLPKEMAKGQFVPLYKKGAVDAMENYRFICLLPHHFKLLSTLVYNRVVRETEWYLPDSQAGFRKGRGGRDNVFILQSLINWLMKHGMECVLTFIDYSAAFDSVSHRFMDEALGEARASNKVRAMVRAIYSVATAEVRVAKDGSAEFATSQPFPINRGVVQGDVLSPWLFIIALARIRELSAEILLKLQGGERGGVQMGDVIVEELAYADDDAKVDDTVQAAQEKLDVVDKLSTELADLGINVRKTKVMHVSREWNERMAVSEEDIARLAVDHGKYHPCDCGKVFLSENGLRYHTARWCGLSVIETFEHEYEVRRILEVRGKPGERFFRVEWVGWTDPKDYTWEPERHLEKARDLVVEFWRSHQELSPDQEVEHEEEHRCRWCCQFFGTERGLGVHARSCPLRSRDRGQNSKSTKIAQRLVKVEKSRDMEKVKLRGEELQNVFSFCYLGVELSADGDSLHAVEARLAAAGLCFGKLHEIWRAKILNLNLRLRLYIAAVVSVGTHGFESWNFTEAVMKKLRGWNGRCLSRITGRSVKRESSVRKRPTFDLVQYLRARRLKWLGEILRSDDPFEHALLKGAILNWEKPYPEGWILMDAPKHEVPSELIEKAKDPAGWNEHIREYLDLGDRESCPVIMMSELQYDGRRGLENYNV